MAAGVHLSGVLAGMGEGVELLHGQGVHVGAQTNGARAIAAFDDAHHACGAHAPVDGNSPGRELLGHHIGGALLLETQLRVGVDVSAHGGQAVGLGQDFFNDFHTGLSSAAWGWSVYRIGAALTAPGLCPCPYWHWGVINAKPCRRAGVRWRPALCRPRHWPGPGPIGRGLGWWPAACGTWRTNLRPR